MKQQGRLTIVGFMLLLFSTVSLAEIDYARKLQWQEKWEKIVTSSSLKYAQRYQNTALKDLSQQQQRAAYSEILGHARAWLSWEKYQPKVTQAFQSACGDEVLGPMVRAKQGQFIADSEREKLAMQYADCASQAVISLSRQIIDSISELDTHAIVARYQAAGPARYSVDSIISNKALKSYLNRYEKETKYKAFAQSEINTWAWRTSTQSPEDAVAKALKKCRHHNGKYEKTKPCKIININGEWQAR